MADDNKELLDSIKNITEESARQADELKRTSDEAVRHMDEAARHRKDALKHMLRSVSQLTGDLYRGQSGYKAFDGALAEADKALGSTSKYLMMIPQTKLAGYVLKAGQALVHYTRAVGEMLDKQFELFQTLSKSGAAASDGMTGAAQDARDMGLLMKDFEGYGQLIAANSKSLAMFGGTAAQGRHKLAQISKEVQNDRAGYMALGMTVGDLNEGIAGYVTQQNLMGGVGQRTDREIARASAGYIQEMDVLTKLTGASRKELEDQRASALTQEQFAAAVQKAREEGREKDAQAMLAMSSMMSQMAGPESAKGLQAWFSGNLQDPAARKLLLKIGGDAANDLYEAGQGLKDPMEAMQGALRGMKRTRDQLGQTLGQVGAFNKTFGDLNEVVKASAWAQKDLKKDYDRLVAQQKRAMALEADAATGSQAELRNAQLELSQSMQDLVRAGAGPVTVAFKVFTGMIKASTWVLEKLNSIMPGSSELKAKETKAETLGEKAQADAKKAQEKAEADAKVKAETTAKAAKDKIEREAKAKPAPPPAPPPPASAPAPAPAPTMPVPTAAPAPAYRPEGDRAGYRRRPGEPAPAAAPAPAILPVPTAPPPSSEIETVIPSKPAIKEKILDGLSQASSAGLILRQTGDVAHGLLTPAALEIAKQIQNVVPLFKMFTGLNDYYHQKNYPDSKHGLGKGMDFVLSNAPTPEESQQVREMLKNIPGVQYVANEYYYPPIGQRDKRTTGPHFHVQTMANGGITRGTSIVGEAGAEAVIPLKSGNVPVDLGVVGDLIRDLKPLDDPETLRSTLRESVMVDMQSAIKSLATELAKPKPNQVEMLDLLREINRTHETSADLTAKIARSAMN